MVLRNPDHKKQRAFPVLRTAAGAEHRQKRTGQCAPGLMGGSRRRALGSVESPDGSFSSTLRDRPSAAVRDSIHASPGLAGLLRDGH
jgi:hypothetical protein